MKRLLLLSALIISCVASAQIPQGISYQAIALNTSGNPVASGNVGLRLSILDGSATGTSVYSETHIKTTNAQGLFNLVIGQGSTVAGSFPGINWGSGSKFLKVEMDVAGGSNYVLVGTTQLLSVPYAMAAKSLVLAPGQGITLTSPGGTPYELSVNDAGQLSLPTSSTTGGGLPNNIYLYGTFNGYDPSTALLMTQSIDSQYKIGFKYLPTGTQLKFTSQNSPGGAVYGIDASDDLIINGGAYTIPSTGLYLLRLYRFVDGSGYYLTITSIAPKLHFADFDEVAGTYDSATNTLTFIANGITTSNHTNFQFDLNEDNGYHWGDNLADGNTEENGASINFPSVTSTPKNFRVQLILNFNGSGTYTITQIP